MCKMVKSPSRAVEWERRRKSNIDSIQKGSFRRMAHYNRKKPIHILVLAFWHRQSHVRKMNVIKIKDRTTFNHFTCEICFFTDTKLMSIDHGRQSSRTFVHVKPSIDFIMYEWRGSLLFILFYGLVVLLVLNVACVIPLERLRPASVFVIHFRYNQRSNACTSHIRRSRHL